MRPAQAQAQAPVDSLGVATGGAQQLSNWVVHLADEAAIKAGVGNYNVNHAGVSKYVARSFAAMVNDCGFS